jgi:hypothetical protein
MQPSNLNSSSLTQRIMRYSGGLIKSKKQADYVLVGFVVLTFALSLVIIFGVPREAKIDPNDYPYGIVSPDET